MVLGIWLLGLLGCGLKELIWTVQTGWQQATLEIRTGVLHSHQVSPFGTRARRWPCGEIAAIHIDSRGGREGSGGGITGSPAVPWINEVRIRLSDGRTAVLLAGREKRETDWIVFLLQEAVPKERRG